MPYLPTDFHVLRIFTVNIIIIIFETKILDVIQFNNINPYISNAYIDNFLVLIR